MKKVIFGILFFALAGIALLYLTFPETILWATIRWERSGAGLSQKSVEVAGQKISYLERSGETPILLLHGFAADKDNWTRFAAHLPPSYRIVAPDLPPFGESPAVDSASYDIASQVERIEALVEKLGLRQFHLAGNSMGGQISAAYAAAYPHRVLSLGLFAPAGIESPEPSEMKRMLKNGRNPLVVGSPEDFDRLLDFVFVQKPFIPAPIRRYLARQALLHRESNLRVWKDLHAQPLSLEPLLAKIQAKTLILWGDSDRILHPSAAQIFHAGIAHSVVVLLKKCGHAPMIERPAEVANHYLKLLKRSSSDQASRKKSSPANSPSLTLFLRSPPASREASRGISGLFSGPGTGRTTGVQCSRTPRLVAGSLPA